MPVAPMGVKLHIHPYPFLKTLKHKTNTYKPTDCDGQLDIFGINVKMQTLTPFQ